MDSHGATATQRHGKEKERFLDCLRAAPSKKLWLHRFGVTTLRARTVDWRALRARCKAWARHPTNAALLVWLAFVAAGVAFVFLLMTGALNSAVPDASRRRRWTEVANQVLNALFTVMCVYQHPRLCHHLALLLRWRDADARELRGVYCSNAGGARRERLHVGVVLLLLHATCFAQYAYCALFWSFTGQTRPDWAVNLCMALGLGFPVAAALYMVYGPLGGGKSVLPESSDEAVLALEESTAVNASRSQYSGRVVVTKAEWAGGLFDLADDPAVAALSLTCTFCVLGWNMERLGLGNMYVHVFTFALLCAAPVLVFAVAALNIHDATLGCVVGAAGALLSVLGLLYGGFWRAQMRRRLGLPADRSVCGGRPATADYVKWLLCAPCALAQEVRTGNLYYDVEDVPVEEKEKPAMAPLDREGRAVPWTAGNAVATDAPPVPVMITATYK
jgi:Cys-rich protein (TIGR01571 family)